MTGEERGWTLGLGAGVLLVGALALVPLALPRPQVPTVTRVALPEGELEASKAETGEIPDQYWLITNWTDPTKQLLDPEVDPDIGGSSWWDLISSESRRRRLSWAATWICPGCGRAS